MVDVARYLDPARPVRRIITATLVGSGAIAGALFGLAITPLGKFVTGAPPADNANYLWNAAVFALMGGMFAPLVTWSTLRDVPLWKSVVQPLVGAAVGAGVAALLGSGIGLLALPPIGAVAGIARLASRRKTVRP